MYEVDTCMYWAGCKFRKSGTYQKHRWPELRDMLLRHEHLLINCIFSFPTRFLASSPTFNFLKIEEKAEMPEKRKTPSSSDPGTDSPYAKRSRPQTTTLYADADDVDGGDDDHEEEESGGVRGRGGGGGGGLLSSSLKYARVRPRSDPVYGQKSAFPGLDDPDAVGADELFYGGPAEDGLEYLRMVR